MAENPGKSSGAIAGLIIGVLLLTFGFKRTLILILLMILGIVIGNLFDSRELFRNLNIPFIKKRNRQDDYTDRDIDLG
jgi:uncharacterized membrane protein